MTEYPAWPAIQRHSPFTMPAFPTWQTPNMPDHDAWRTMRRRERSSIAYEICQTMRRRERPSGGQATDHDIAEFVGTPLYKRVADLAALCFPGEQTAPHRPRRPPPRPRLHRGYP